MLENTDPIDVGALPDSSGSIATPIEEAPSLTLENPEGESALNVEDKTISEEADGQPEAEISDDLKSEMESVIEAKSDDSALVKKLRDLVKTKYDDYAKRVQPELSEAQQQALELANGLFEFDVERGTATTRNFAQKLAQKDMGIASQAFDDLSSLAVDENGFTLGHRFLEKIGLDPYKIEELRQFSRGELNPTDYGITTVPESIPREYAEAYKSLDPVTRTDVDIYLDSENEGQKMAAMRTLRDRQANIDNDRRTEEYQTHQQAQFTQEVTSATEADLQTTYQGVLTSLKSNPAYTNVTISSDPNVDAMVKESIISGLNALGDPRSVLAQHAIQTFEARGVKVDVAKIEGLMRTIEEASRTAIVAERQGKLQGRDYSTQIQEALARKSTATSQLLAQGNKYFSQTLASLSGKGTAPNPVGGTPKLEGNNSPIVNRPQGVKNFADLDKEVLEIAKNIAAGA